MPISTFPIERFSKKLDFSSVLRQIIATTYVLLFLLLGFATWAAELTPAPATIPELVARDRTRYTNVIVTKLDQGKVSFQYDDGVTTRPLAAFDDNSLERLIPGHLASLKAKQAESDAKEQQRERTRDAQRKQNPAAAALARKEDDIFEAAIRYALTHFEAPDLTRVSAIIVEIDGDTPSDEFLKRFAGHVPPVQKIPRSRRRQLLASELSCGVGGLKWLSDTEAEISVFRMVGIDAVAFLYTMRLTNRGWEIVKLEITGIS